MSGSSAGNTTDKCQCLSTHFVQLTTNNILLGGRWSSLSHHLKTRCWAVEQGTWLEVADRFGPNVLLPTWHQVHQPVARPSGAMVSFAQACLHNEAHSAMAYEHKKLRYIELPPTHNRQISQNVFHVTINWRLAFLHSPFSWTVPTKTKLAKFTSFELSKLDAEKGH